MKTFKGLSLSPEDAFQNIAVMIEVGLLLTVIDIEDKSTDGDHVLFIAKEYAEAAAEYVLTPPSMNKMKVVLLAMFSCGFRLHKATGIYS